MGLAQGLTEFLPISSSGHLVFLQQVFGFKKPMLGFDILLHLATVLAVIVFLRRELFLIIREVFSSLNSLFQGQRSNELWEKFYNFKLFILILFALLPTILAGWLLKESIEKIFISLLSVGIGVLITGIVLFFTKFIMPKKDIKNFNLRDAFFVGVAQAIAIVPGISRSGLTISAGIFCGLDKNLAVKFSFLLSVPTVLAASLYKIKGGFEIENISALILVFSFLVAFVTGYLALIFLSKVIAKARFHYFSYYCFLFGLVSIVLSIINK